MPMSSEQAQRNFAGIHRGETGLIIGNGPSLKDVSFDFLNRHIKIACNHYGCACDHNKYLPQAEYWSQLGYNQVQTMRQREHYYPAIEGARLAFVNKHMIGQFPQDNVVGILSRNGLGLPMPGPHGNRAFSGDPLYAVGVGFTQLYVNFQIAYWLGFETLLIVGLDEGYEAAQKKYGQRHFYPDAAHNSAPPYHGEQGFIDGSNYVFGLAKEAFEADGRRIINLSNPTMDRVFEKGNIEDYG